MLISETVPAVLQVMPVQSQRLWILLRDQEWSDEDDNKLFFHRTRACASVFGDGDTFSGSVKTKKTLNRIRTIGLLNIPMLGYFVSVFCLKSSNIFVDLYSSILSKITVINLISRPWHM